LLVVEDPELARWKLAAPGDASGLPLLDPVQQPAGPWLHGEVRQAGAQEEGTGQYTCRVYFLGGGGRDYHEDFPGGLDIHEAKFSLASRVRAQLAG
jgi:hypothetical protein